MLVHRADVVAHVERVAAPAVANAAVDSDDAVGAPHALIFQEVVRRGLLPRVQSHAVAVPDPAEAAAEPLGEFFHEFRIHGDDIRCRPRRAG